MRDFHYPGRSTVHAQNGMVATSHPLAAKVALNMMEAGGNAVDAAIAGAVLLGICEPQMTGIGGDCFVLLSPPGGRAVVGLNGSGRAPAALSAENLRGQGQTSMPLRSADSVTIPGAVDAFCTLSKDWGALPLSQVLAPSIRYAEDGVPVAPRVAIDWAESIGNLYPTAARFYALDGSAPKVGQIFRAPGQAAVLRAIAANGRAGFYEGAVAEDMIRSLQALGGVHQLDDFAATRADYTVPISGTYGDTTLLEHPPNGQGATAVLLLNILKHFDLAGMDPLGAERAHIEAEATKLAYDARNRLIADPDHTERLDHMLAPETAENLAALIDPKRSLPPALPGAEAIHKDTVYITVVDKDRMAVSLIYSIFHAFGSGIASDRFGILFQNRGAGFTLEAGHPNEAAGGKRPMHTIIPGMLSKAEQVTTSFGVMGGAYQSTGHARFVSNLVDFGMDEQEALDAPRCFAEGQELRVEPGYSADVLQALKDRGQNLVVTPSPIGGGQAITISENGTLIGASDPRKDGCALGY